MREKSSRIKDNFTIIGYRLSDDELQLIPENYDQHLRLFEGRYLGKEIEIPFDLDELPEIGHHISSLLFLLLGKKIPSSSLQAVPF